MNARRIAWSIVGVLSLSAPVKSSDPIAILTPSDAARGFGGGFGNSAAISGDWLVMGAPYDTEFQYYAGAAYVFRRVGTRWVGQQKLVAPTLFIEEQFGTSVAIDGDWMVIGAGGQAFVLRRNDRGTPQDLSNDFWDLAAILNPPPSHLGYSFGGIVRIDGDVIVVGAPRGYSDPGRAYTFRWDGAEWIGPDTLMPSDPQQGDLFGTSVAVNGTMLVIGAYRGRGAVDQAGAAYVFRRNGTAWIQEAKLVASDGHGGDFFGAAVAISGDDVLVGAPGTNDPRLEYGATYVFRLADGQWIQTGKLSPSNVTGAYPQFGSSLAADQDLLLIGALAETWAYVFHRDDDGWKELDRFPSPGETFFPRLAIDGRFALSRNYVYAVGERFTLADYASFQNCFLTGGQPPLPVCQSFDFERDGRIDGRDLPLWLLTFRGP
jgi:hypothetical protein